MIENIRPRMPYAITNANDWKLMKALFITFHSWVDEPDPYTGDTLTVTT
jgi:hypothetical protein